MSKEHSVDIDDELDFAIADFYFNRYVTENGTVLETEYQLGRT